MTKLHHAKHRFGFTGTLDGTQTHKWVLEGLFGPNLQGYKNQRTDGKGTSFQTGYHVSGSEAQTTKV